MKGWVCGLSETFPVDQSDPCMWYEWPISAQHESPRAPLPRYKSQWAPSSQIHYTPHHHLVPSLPAVRGLGLGRNQIMENHFYLFIWKLFYINGLMVEFMDTDVQTLSACFCDFFAHFSVTSNSRGVGNKCVYCKLGWLGYWDMFLHYPSGGPR